MVFSSPIFLFYFLPLFLLLYFVLPYKNITLLLASLLFYAWGEPRYVFLLIASALINYGFGVLIAKSSRGKRTYLAVGIAVNLGILFFYKYLEFAVQIINSALASFALNISAPHYLLPLGISFFTFQGISYLIDIFRVDTTAQKSFINFAMYKAMFPQLIAGPIVRYRQIESQIESRPYSNEKVWLGTAQFAIGLVQKVLIANAVGLPADRIFAVPIGGLSTVGAWVGILCYTVQIYYDFAGYSNMAIGLGHILGFNYPPNFNDPYSSRSITDFWRRWHISLSSWFRDYLYIPLGGNRGGSWRTYFNLSLVFLLCGLWHGAAWTFVIWGAWHGFLLVAERMRLGRVLNSAPLPIAKFYTLIAVMIGWVFFRAKDVPYALGFLGTMFSHVPHGEFVRHWRLDIGLNGLYPLAIGLILSVFDLRAARVFLTQKVGHSILYRILFGSLISGLLVLAAASLASGTYNPFIYFRF